MSVPTSAGTARRPSAASVRETFAVLGVVASLAFVGLQIRESNIQARAAAYQAIGIATSEFHRSFDARLNRLATESAYADAVQRWSLADWESFERIMTADLRMLETILLQVDQGLLPSDATTRLGYNWGPILANPAFACVWPELKSSVGASVQRYVEDATPAASRFACAVDLEALRRATVSSKQGQDHGA